MRKYTAKVDVNQPEIVKGLRKVGASVALTHGTGKGFPDLVVGYQGRNYLIEVIGPDKLSRFRQNGGLSDNQVEWHDAWRGQVCKVNNLDEALEAIGATGP